MDGGSAVSSLLEWKVPEKQGEEARMIRVVMDESWNFSMNSCLAEFR